MDTKYLAIFILCSTFTLSLCNKPDSKVCDKNKKYEATVTSIDVSATVDSNRVIHLKKGTNVSVSFNFKMSDGQAKQVTAIVHGIIAGVPIPFSGVQSNACKGCGLSCPISKPNAYDYKAIIPVKPEYPSLRVVVKWQLNDEHGNEIWCEEMPAEIES